MIKVKTLGCSLKIFHAAKELPELDETINDFLQKENISPVLSAGDEPVTGLSGATIGVMRVVAYDDEK